jgi:hypothetical protein
VYGYDPAKGVQDDSGYELFGGEVVRPLLLRAVRMSWPVTQGMGVYHRAWHSGDGAATLLDITPYVEWEDPSGAQLEVISAGNVDRFSLTGAASRADLVTQAAERIRASNWDTYTPSFSATGGGYALGNGTLVAGFRRDGTTLHLRGQLTFGTTTTSGTGAWLIGLPAGMTSSAAQTQTGTASANNASGQRFTVGLAIGASSTTFVLPSTIGGELLPGSSGGAISPFGEVWATSDTISWNATIELTP